MNTIAQRFKALSDPTRLRLLNLLQTGELCVCELMVVLDLPQSTVSRHLATLRHTGFVTGARRGQWMYYRLTPGHSGLVEKLLDLIRTDLALHPQAADDLATLNRLQTDKSNRCPVFRT